MIYSAMNVTLLLMSCLVLIVLMISLLGEEDVRTRQGKVFLAILGLTILALLCDAVTWVVDTVPGDFYRVLNVVCSFLNVIFLAAAALGYTGYISVTISLKTQTEARRSRLLIKCAAAMTLIMSAVLVVSQFNGIIYTISPDNVYAQGPFYLVLLIYIILMFLLDTVLVFLYRKRLRPKEIATLLSFIYIPLLAVLVQCVFPELMVVYASFALSLLVIYCNYQSQYHSQLKMEVLDSRVSAMLSQIKPHFLYNSLSVIENLCVEDPDQAREAVHEFSRYLRGNLDSLDEKGLVPFAQELEHAKNYLKLEQKRFGDDLEVIYDIRAHDFFLPSLTVQPLVENAVRHGILKREGGGTLVVQTDEAEDAWHILVSDNGVGFAADAESPKGKGHIGIENVRMRLRAQCEGTLDLASEPGEGTQIRITVPKPKEAW